MFVDPAEDPRTYGAPEGELATYREYLANYRLTLDLKCSGLDPDQLASRAVPPSSLSLLGLVRHLARVEQFWFRIALQGVDEPRLYDDGDSGFADVEPTTEAVEDALATWRRQVALADEWLDDCGEESMADLVTFREDAETSSIRDILVHMVEEYARHCGHADLLREVIDGRTGQ